MKQNRIPTVPWDARLDIMTNVEDSLPGHVTETSRPHDREHTLIQSVSSTKHLSESIEDSISDEENGELSRSSSNPRVVESRTSLSSKFGDQYGACMQSTIVEKIHDLATIHEKIDNNPYASAAYEICTGNKGKEKFKSFGHENIEPSYEDDPIETELLSNTQKGGDEQFIKVASHGQRSVATSMTELLENLQQDEPSLRHSSLLLQNMKRRNQHTLSARKRILPHMVNKSLENEDDHLECSGSEMLSENKDNNKNQFSAAIQKITGPTMTDLLQEAFSHSEVEAPTILKSKNSGIGYNGRLQQVLQNEKDSSLEFSKYLQTGTMLLKNVRPDFLGSLVVQILSRCLEAKLTVCQCLFAEQNNGVNQFIDSAEKKKMVIFNSKICDNVELDVGNFIRIFPPWIQSNHGLITLNLGSWDVAAPRSDITGISPFKLGGLELKTKYVFQCLLSSLNFSFLIELI